VPPISGSWQFVEARKAGVSQDPTQSEFFAPEEGLTGALVRESVQNSLDAQAIREEPVKLRFAFGVLEDHSYPSSSYLAGLQKHLTAQAATNLPAPGSELKFLSIEDFGTRGLEGSPSHSIFDEKSQAGQGRNDFYYFWRNVGRSVKVETQRGRWGLGKAVFPVSSDVNSFWGITWRRSDNKILLMGQSVGKVHSIPVSDYESKVYEAYGYFALFDQEGFACPIVDPAVTQQFIQNFDLKRNVGPGFSVVIPYPNEDLSPEKIVREVIRSYYIPVLGGQLSVEAQSYNGQQYVLNRENISEVIQQIEWADSDVKRAEMLELVSFARKVRDLDPASTVTIGPPAARGAPSITEERFDPEQLLQLKSRLEAEELIAMRVPVIVKKGPTKENSHFDAYLQKDPALSSGTGEFVRQGLAISQVRKSPRQPIRALLLVDDKPLSTLLGDSENPAHTKWQERSEKIKAPAYEAGLMTVRMCVNALQKLAELLSHKPEAKDENLLSEFFFIPQSDNDNTGGAAKPKEGETGTTETPDIVVEPRQRAFTLVRIPGGFRVTGNAEAQERPAALSIQVAYAVRSGNPFTKYRAFDFDLTRDKKHLRGKGGEIKDIGPNSLIFDITDPDFVLQVSEFDPKRDLEVRIVALSVEFSEEESA
jgi:hypothetical protein